MTKRLILGLDLRHPKWSVVLKEGDNKDEVIRNLKAEAVSSIIITLGQVLSNKEHPVLTIEEYEQ